MAKNLNSYSNFYLQRDLRNYGYPDGVQPIDLRYDVGLYGRVDSRQDAVMLTNKFIVTNLPSDKDGVYTIKQLESKRPTFALNFVADAFKDMKQHFSKANAFGRLATGGMDEIIAMEAKAGWKEPQLAYDEHIVIAFRIFTDRFLFGSRKYKEIVSFDDYMKYFDDFYKSFGHEIPLTKTGFLKSRLASPLVSGTMIEVAKIDPSDGTAATKWISDPNFNFYRNAAIKHGFLVDEYVPWRLVADLSSKFMQDYWQKTTYPTAEEISFHKRHKVTGLPRPPDNEHYLTDEQIIKKYVKTKNKYGLTHNPGSASDLFEQYYEKTFLTDALELKEIFYKMYNEFVQESPAISRLVNVSCVAKKLSKKLIKRIPLTATQLDKHYDIHYWMEKCFKIRLKEEGIEMERADYDRVLRNARMIVKKTFDIDSAMKYTNNMVKVFKSQIVKPEYCQNYERCL